MGFRYRKSINLGKGFRINMSKSGPGFSRGGKGFRVTRTANGNIRGSAYIPGTGIGYQKDFGNPTKNLGKILEKEDDIKKRDSKKGEKGSDQNINITTHYSNMDSIRVSELSDILEAYDSIRRYNQISYILIGLGLILAFINPLLLLIAVLGIALKLYLNSKDKIRIDYDMTDDAKTELKETNKLLEGILESDKVWLVTEVEELDEDDIGQMRIIKRIPLTLYKGSLDTIETNADALSLRGDNIELTFLPDALFIREGNKLKALSFKEMEINVGTLSFIEEEVIPKDTTVLDNTYKHMNKDGSPDKRYKDNPKLPIVEYGVLSLYNNSGLDTLIVFSDTELDGK